MESQCWGGGSRRLLTSQFREIDKLWVHRETLYQKIRWWGRDASVGKVLAMPRGHGGWFVLSALERQRQDAQSKLATYTESMVPVPGFQGDSTTCTHTHTHGHVHSPTLTHIYKYVQIWRHTELLKPGFYTRMFGMLTKSSSSLQTEGFRHPPKTALVS